MMEDIIMTIVTIILSALTGGAIAYLGGVIKIKGRVCDLEKWRTYGQQDIDNSMEERSIILRGLLACLRGLQEQGCNGPVTTGIKELEDYMNEKAHIPRSYVKDL